MHRELLIHFKKISAKQNFVRRIAQNLRLGRKNALDAKIWREITLEKTIYGGKPKNPAAYCALHNGSLTVKEMKKKGCLGKQCHHLRKNEQHEYWNQRQIMKARKES